jgi:hypothetical protein
MHEVAISAGSSMLDQPRRRRPRALTGFVLLALALATSLTSVTPARGQDAQTQAMGRTLFNEGVALYNKGDFEAACPKLEASLKAYAGVGTRGKLAECYEKLGRYASAYAAYREVAQLATRSGDPAREQVASERAKSLEPKLSYVTVTVPPANDVAGLVVKRNGREVERAKLGSAEPVDAGSVAFEVSAPGRRSFNGKVTVAQGQAARFEVPALALEVAPPPPVTSSPTSTPAPALAPPPVSADDSTALYGDRPSWQRPLGFVLLGSGVVAMGVGGFFGLSAKTKYNDAFDGGGCVRATKTCDAPGQAAVDDARSKATLSTILFGAGGGLAVVGAIVLLTAPSNKPGALRLAPTTYAGGAGLTLGGSLQ